MGAGLGAITDPRESALVCMKPGRSRGVQTWVDCLTTLVDWLRGVNWRLVFMVRVLALFLLWEQ